VNVLCIRQQTTAAELRDARQQAAYLERDNAALYAEIAELRLSSQQAASADTLRRELQAAASRVSQLESDVEASRTELAVKTAAMQAAEAEAAELRQLRKSLQDEIRRLQEKSTSTLDVSTARRSYASRNSVRLSHACFVTNP